jgi:hypothetical protein
MPRYHENSDDCLAEAIGLCGYSATTDQVRGIAKARNEPLIRVMKSGEVYAPSMSVRGGTGKSRWRYWVNEEALPALKTQLEAFAKDAKTPKAA